MQSTREELADAILAVLQERGQSRARDIVWVLSDRPEFRGLSKTDVNSILYAELAEHTRHDEEFRWSVRTPDGNRPPGAANLPIQKADDTSIGIADRPEHEEDQRQVANQSSREAPTALPSLLRTVHRLRAGLPPSERLQELTVGPRHHVAAFHSLTSGPAADPRWLIVNGDYGEGKSHTLSMLRELGHSRQYATCHLSCDGSASALNQPQRFLFNMLATLEIPEDASRGYEDLLYNLLTDARHASAISDSVTRHFRGNHVPELESRLHLAHLLYILTREANTAPEDLAIHVRPIVAHLSGSTIRHRASTPEVRALCYAILRIAVDVLRHINMRGLLILLDEVESVFTKLANAASRRGAYRVMAALCESRRLKDCIVVMATTPDALCKLVAAGAELRSDRGDLPAERVETWAARLSSGSVATLVCKPLKTRDRHSLMTRVRDLYSKVYDVGNTLPSRTAWEGFSATMSALEIPVRLLVRQTVDYLDAMRYRQGD